MQNLLLLVLILPLISFIIIASSGRYIGVYGSMLLSVINMWCAFFTAHVLFFFVSFDAAVYIEL